MYVFLAAPPYSSKNVIFSSCPSIDRRPIFVFDKEGLRAQYGAEDPTLCDVLPIRLSFLHGNHYDAVYPMEFVQSAIDAQSMGHTNCLHALVYTHICKDVYMPARIHRTPNVHLWRCIHFDWNVFRLREVTRCFVYVVELVNVPHTRMDVHVPDHTHASCCASLLPQCFLSERRLHKW